MAVWFITGAGRGLGAAIVRQVLARGDKVVAASRRPEAAPGLDEKAELLSVRLDVTSESDAVRAVEEAVERFGRIDFLVNNAGRSLLGAVEASASDVQEVFDTNLFGALAVTRAVLPVMRRQRAGTVVNIGSMGGFAQSPGWGVYGATKFALEGISEALAAELQPLGIHVTVVEPGSFRTDFLDSTSLRFASTTIADYAATVDPVRAASRSRSGIQVNDPDLGAAAIVDAVTAETPPFRLPLGRDAVSTVERKLEAVRLELDRWRSISESTQAQAPGMEQAASAAPSHEQASETRRRQLRVVPPSGRPEPADRASRHPTRISGPGGDPHRVFDLGFSAHLDELAAHLDLIAVGQLSATPAFDFPVHPHLAVGNRLPGVRTLVDQVGELQELTQPDGVVSDRNCSRTHGFSRTPGILRHHLIHSAHEKVPETLELPVSLVHVAVRRAAGPARLNCSGNRSVRPVETTETNRTAARLTLRVPRSTGPRRHGSDV